jgi:hypothetical protein
MRTLNDSVAEAISTEQVVVETTAPQQRLFEWNEVVAIVSEFVWRDVPPLESEDEEETAQAYRSRLNEYAEQEVLKIMYAPTPEV